VNKHRFVNQSQPQTLYMAVILCYINAVFNILGFGSILVLLGIALAAGGYGIANEKKWGYSLAVVAAVVQVLLVLYVFQGSTFTDILALLNFVFDAALVALLLHPLSRDYQRIWFR
jgi:hypothetical protein